MEQLEIPPNPRYGEGLFIRSLHLATPQPQQVLLAMEDMGHAFQIRFDHDDQVITRIKARWHRHPLSTCPGAPDALQALVGCPVSDNVFDPQNFTDSMQQCTHMFDMMRVGIVHAAQKRADRRYDVIIRDQLVGPQLGELLCNGERVFAITVLDNVIDTPPHYRGGNLIRGFAAWAKAHASATDLEYLFMLQRGFFIAHGRRREYAVFDNQSAAISGMRAGVCYASQPERYAQAIRLETAKDFSDTPEQVLSFFPLADV